MSLVSLALFAAFVAGPTADPDPTALVAKLASAEPTERAAATESLKTLGRESLPALEKAMKGDDTGLRDRATALWETIQRDLMTRASLVRLADLSRPREAILEDLEKQTGLTLQIDQSAQHGLAPPREPGTVPLWTALERLGLKAAYHQNPGEGRFPRLDLRNDPLWTFTSNAGPFQVSLTGLHLHRDRQLISGPWVGMSGQRINVPSEDIKGDSITSYGDLDVMVEPRMWLTQEAPARLTEATDDLGQSLVPEADDLATRPNGTGRRLFNPGHGATQMQAGFRLRPTEKPGHVARLRGVVPVMLHLRRPEPMLIIPLADAAGKTFKCDDAEFTIQSVNHTPTATTVRMSVHLNLAKADLPDNPENELPTSRLLFLGFHQIQLIDSAGKVVAYAAGGGSGGGSTPSVYQWTISSFQKGPATHLRYYSMLRVRSEAAFDFRDVPLP